MYNPDLDGVDHLNVYSKAKTKLGRELSHFAHTPIEIPEHGRFASVEGYWYWLSSRRDELRELHGVDAKAQGRSFRDRNQRLPDTHPDKKLAVVDNFSELIMQANRIKIDTYPGIKSMLINSDLPLVHYYVMYRDHQQTVKVVDGDSWVWNDIAKYRAELKGEPEPVFDTIKPKREVEEDQLSLF